MLIRARLNVLNHSNNFNQITGSLESNAKIIAVKEKNVIHANNAKRYQCDYSLEIDSTHVKTAQSL